MRSISAIRFAKHMPVKNENLVRSQYQLAASDRMTLAGSCPLHFRQKNGNIDGIDMIGRTGGTYGRLVNRHRCGAQINTGSRKKRLSGMARRCKDQGA